jgi:hypothetical protein
MCLTKNVRTDQQAGNVEGGRLINDVMYKNSNNNQRNALLGSRSCGGVFFPKWLISRKPEYSRTLRSLDLMKKRIA